MNGYSDEERAHMDLNKCYAELNSCYRTKQPESGRVGYLVLYLMGAPLGLLLLLWMIFGSNLLGAG